MRRADTYFRVCVSVLTLGWLLCSSQAANAAEQGEPVPQPTSFFWHVVYSNGIIFGPLMLLLALAMAGIIIHLAWALRRGRLVSQTSGTATVLPERTAGWGRQERALRWLGALGLLSPMFGLLGTVLGVMLLCKAAAGANGVASEGMLVTGVSHALSVLFEGILLACIAVPAYVLFKNRLQRLRLDMGMAHPN